MSKNVILNEFKTINKMKYLFNKEQMMRFAKLCVKCNCASEVNFRFFFDKEETQQQEIVTDETAKNAPLVDVNNTVCSCKYPMKKKNYDTCAMCGGKWKGRKKK